MPKTRIVLQARLNSTRLPGKMLLPISGVPLIVLCAKRVLKAGYDFVVATSVEESDDLLVKVLDEYKIPYYRGDLENVLGRFVGATKDMDDVDLVVRLTGDNPFIDSHFIDGILEFHSSHLKQYTRSLSPQDGFPYGVSAEVITVGALRDIYSSNPSDYQKEHVTIALTESNCYELYSNSGDDLSHLRVTIDTFEDYLLVAKAFAECSEDPVHVPLWQLVKAVVGFSETPKMRAPYKLDGYKAYSHLALGTAQLGLEYGIANSSGRPNKKQAEEILRAAVSHGIDVFDTGAAYGDSEAVLGGFCQGGQDAGALVVTKLDPFLDIDNVNYTQAEIKQLTEKSVFRSLYRLGKKKLPVLLLHRWAHYSAYGGAIWDTLIELQKRGLIERLGASVQNPSEGLEALDESNISFIQLPYNIIDSRWDQSGFIDKVYNIERKVHIQVRSALLQGALTLPPDRWPSEFDLAEKVHGKLVELVEKYGRESIVDLCYAYVRSQNWINSIVVGVETTEQLIDNVRLFNLDGLEDIASIKSCFEDMQIDDNLLDPAKWQSRS